MTLSPCILGQGRQNENQNHKQTKPHHAYSHAKLNRKAKQNKVNTDGFTPTTIQRQCFHAKLPERKKKQRRKRKKKPWSFARLAVWLFSKRIKNGSTSVCLSPLSSVFTFAPPLNRGKPLPLFCKELSTPPRRKRQVEVGVSSTPQVENLEIWAEN